MPDQQHTPPLCVDRAIAVTEDVVYSMLAIVLVGGAAILIGDAVVHLVDDQQRGNAGYASGRQASLVGWAAAWR